MADRKVRRTRRVWRRTAALEFGRGSRLSCLPAVGAPGGLEDVAELVELDRLEEVVVGAGLQALARRPPGRGRPSGR